MSFSPLSSSSGRPATLTPSYCAKSAGTLPWLVSVTRVQGVATSAQVSSAALYWRRTGAAPLPVSSQRASFSGFSGAESEEVGSVE